MSDEPHPALLGMLRQLAGERVLTDERKTEFIDTFRMVLDYAYPTETRLILCAKEGCSSPHLFSSAYCREHRREHGTL